ncbi:Chromo domain/shadow [Plasmopara halstedii]|uniref:Chromo domain/shadow n=1 Tax=Plasmopara halstedii TaxID=4781 RepID=A0A0P1A591_PLAHL|nr:Chromo domain/shadow [Plasmopara halstedii]CEG35712.1 Chromo domain/shadow [Plasmopara halstedii]|eukprot:XP_024572081.1 Chromo domain/shadow [Plasmopara halstedii]
MRFMNGVLNVEQLKKCQDNPSAFEGRPQQSSKAAKSTPVVVQENEPTYVIEALRKMKTVKGRWQFLVIWAGYPEDENTWGSEQNIPHVSHWKSLLKNLEARTLLLRRENVTN